jgi:hypothetical protein
VSPGSDLSAPGGAAEKPRRGRPPTVGESATLKSAEALGPEQSLTRVDSAARLTFAAVAGSAGLITALGFTETARNVIREGPGLWGIPFAAIALICALLLAGYAIMPRLSSVSLESPSELDRYFRRQIVGRGGAAIVSVVFLTAGALLVVFGDERESSRKVDITLSTSRDLAGARSVVASAVAERLRPGDRMVMDVRIGRRTAPVCSAAHLVARPGRVRLSCGATAGKGGEVLVEYRVRRGKNAFASGSLAGK